MTKRMWCEITVLEAVALRQQTDVYKSRLKTKQAQALLKIPRAHQRYINNEGVYPFITKCQALLDREKN